MRAVEPWGRRDNFEQLSDDALDALPEPLTCTVCNTVVDGLVPHRDGDESDKGVR